MLTLRTFPDPVLKEKCSPVTDLSVVKNSIKDMLTICARMGGVGLAAPQVGITQRFFIMRAGFQWLKIINPAILARAEETEADYEQCLSIPGVEKIKVRNLGIIAQYTTLLGHLRSERFLDRDAVVFQHELDHLDGVLIND